jgi:catechol 2,3-dioxygenase
MVLPSPVYNPPFRITRASHIVLEVSDLDLSQSFYAEVLGLILTSRDDTTVFFRGIEEACHHSLVLRRTNRQPACARIGMRVLTEEDLDRAEMFFSQRHCPVAWVEVPHQGRTLHATDPVGVPLELCAQMTAVPRMITHFQLHKGGCAQRIDHCQILTPEVRQACDFYMSAGFRLSEYIASEDDEALLGVFLQRKGNPHDIVFFEGSGPRLHHFAYFTPQVHHLLLACDMAGALGFGREVERGPGRHGPGHAMYVYFRDPDGHRVELFNTHYQVMDMENQPVRWNATDHRLSFPWGLPAQRKWFEEATSFVDVQLRPSARQSNPLTLEKFLMP